MNAPVKGFRFMHARVLDERSEPMAFVVTRVARGIVYYRPVDGGAPQCCDVAEFPRWCKQ